MQENSESGVNKSEPQSSPFLLLPSPFPGDGDVAGVESEGSSLSTPSVCANVISHDSEARRRSRGSSFSLPSAESILSIFRTPSRKTRGSPSSLDMSLPSSVCTPKTPQSCCTSSSSGSSGKRECELCAICLSPVTSRVKERPVTRTSCQHLFHTMCLQDAKQNCRSECPLCRSVLSPVACLRFDRSGSSADDGPSNMLTAHSMRGAVVAAAARGREAVRRAMLRRAMHYTSEDRTENNSIAVGSLPAS